MVRYSKERPLRVFTAFSGYDSQCLALERLKERRDGFDYELVGWSEIEPNAIKAHNLIFPQWSDRNFGDISKIDWDSAPDFDLFTYSSPCFVAGTLVMTDDGFKKIEDIDGSEMVITHTRNNRRIVKTMKRQYHGDIFSIKSMCCSEIRCTDEHPFYVRERKFTGHLRKRTFSEPKWVKAKDLTKSHYLSLAINNESKIPDWKGSVDNRYGHHKAINKLQHLLDNGDFWYIMGRYVGDGWCKNRNTQPKTGSGIIICCGGRNEDGLIESLNKCGLHYVVTDDKHTRRYNVNMNELCDFVKRYGYLAHKKRIDIETLNLPKNLLQCFLKGYIESDGCFSQGKWKISTASKELAYGVVQCVAKAFNRPCSIYYIPKERTCVIEGRTVNQHDQWQVTWKDNNCKQDKAFYEDGYIWFPLRSISHQYEECEVYNMEVEIDNSYTANGSIVHNCQDFSTAGLQRGGEEGSGTRSSLLWECRRAIVAKRPAYCMLENVKALVSRKFLPLFQKWCDELDVYGYTNYWQVLNAKDYGVPQNRERVFLISVRKDMADCFPYGYKFPRPFPLERHLEDVLEPECDVPRSYYISEKSKAYFSEHCDIDMIKLLGDV